MVKALRQWMIGIQTALLQWIVSLKRWPLWLLALLSLGGYALLCCWFPLTSYFDRSPLPDIRVLTPSLKAGLACAVLLCALFALYWLAYQRIRQGHVYLSCFSVLLVAALFSLPLLLTFSFNATDVYQYFVQGRVYTVYHQSPLSVPPNTFPGDPYVSLIGEWAGATSPYGPVWVLVSAIVTLLSGDNLLLGLLLFKGLAAAFHLAIGGLIWFMLDGTGPSERAGRTLLWAWNPALLLIWSVDGHNDGLMIFWLLLGAWLIRRGRSGVGMVVMALAALTKLVGLILLPFFFLATWQRLPNARARIRFLLTSGIGSLAAAWLAFLPFGDPVDLIRRLSLEASTGGGFSFIALFVLVSRRWGFGLSARLVTRAAGVLFGLLALGLFWRIWKGRSPLRVAVDILTAYLAQSFKFRIWYAAWLLPWLLLDVEEGGARRLRAGLWLTVTGQLSVFIYGHFWFYLLGRDALVTHLIGVPFTFVLPLLKSFWGTGEKRLKRFVQILKKV